MVGEEDALRGTGGIELEGDCTSGKDELARGEVFLYTPIWESKQNANEQIPMVCARLIKLTLQLVLDRDVDRWQCGDRDGCRAEHGVCASVSWFRRSSGFP